MPMRRECRHYYRRSASGGDGIEGCSLDAAPDAPRRCPDNCTWFEKRQLSTAGFVYGSLTPRPADPGSREGGAAELDESSKATLEDVAAFLDEIGDEVVQDERERRRLERSRRPWWKRLF